MAAGKSPVSGRSRRPNVRMPAPTNGWRWPVAARRPSAASDPLQPFDVQRPHGPFSDSLRPLVASLFAYTTAEFLNL
jgi:hypothetical protein